jgi:hypothetical protein
MTPPEAITEGARQRPERRWTLRRSQSKWILAYGSLFLLGAAMNAVYCWRSPDRLSVLAPPNDPGNWQVYTEGGSRASLHRQGGALRLDISVADGVDQHVQCFQRGVDLQDSHSYTLRFRARANTLRDAQVEAHLDQPDYHNVGLKQIVPLLPVWQTFTYTFRATRPLANDTSVPAFALGNKPGTVWLADVSLNEDRVGKDHDGD